MENVKDSIIQKLRGFSVEICRELQDLGVPDGARACPQMLGSADHKLGEMITELKESVTNRQRDISRVITPHVQVGLCLLVFELVL